MKSTTELTGCFGNPRPLIALIILVSTLFWQHGPLGTGLAQSLPAESAERPGVQPKSVPSPSAQDSQSPNESADLNEKEEFDATRDQRVTRDEIAAATSRLAALEDLDEAQRESVQKLLLTATSQLDSFESFQTQIEDLDKQIARIPVSLSKLQERQGETLETPESWIVQQRGQLKELEQVRELIRVTEAELDKLNKTLTSRRAEAERRPVRLTEIPSRISELEPRLEQLDQQLKLPPAPNEIPALIEARNLQLGAEWMNVGKEIEFLKKEQERYRVGRELLPLQIQFAQKDIQYKTRVLQLLKELFEERQADQLREVREESLRRLETTSPLLRAMVEHDLYDVAEIEESSEQLRKTATQIEETGKLKKNYDAQFVSIQERFRAIGGSNALGTVLRSSKKELDESRSLISAAQLQDERQRVAGQERNVLLQNELQQFSDIPFVAARLRDESRTVVANSPVDDPAQIQRLLAEDDFPFVRELAGMPVAGIQHENALPALAQMVGRDIAELKPTILARIAELRESANSQWGLDRNRPEVVDLAVRLFLFQDKFPELGPDELAWLQTVNQVSLIKLGEETFLAQAEQLLAERVKMIQNQLNVIEDENVQLAELDLERQATLKLLDQYLVWIDERVIWIRSAAWPTWKDAVKAKQAAVWFLNPKQWFSIVSDLSGIIRDGSYLMYWLGYLVVLALLVFRGRLKRVLKVNGELAAKRHCMKILPTTKSLVATIVIAAAWPMFVYLTGRLLIAGAAVNSFGWSIGQSLTGVAYLIGALELLRILCSEQGLACAHFGWPEKTRQFIRAKIRGFYSVAIPLLFIQGVLLAQPNEEYRNSLGRLASILLFGVAAVYLHRIFRPQGVVFQQMAMNHQLTVVYSLRSIIQLAAVALPLGLLILALSGYYYTAYQLGASLEKSMSFIVLVLLVGGFLFRWLLVTRRSQAMEEARRMRQEMEANPERSDVAEGAQTPIEQLMEELLTVNRQAREVVVSFLWLTTFLMLYWIWRDMLPAVGILNHYPLWSVNFGTEVKDVTLMSVFNACLTLLITWMLIRNMPGLLNMAVQTYSTLDSGARYAVTTLFRYVITIIGGIVALNFLHIQWAQYGWLVAAVSVGLGFGLQEIVANFVSGLILLFERPLRIGDTITIDGQNGQVIRIQMRATTIRTWDYQELIIPNKDLMTGKLLNWTLTNSTNRLVLTIGVAYGNDPDRVRDILSEVVLGHPEVVKDPAPTIGMEEFGDSALLFSIRLLLNSMESRIRIRHELNAAISRALVRESIEIPFPQLDLHLVSDKRRSKTTGLDDLPGRRF